LNLNLDGVRLFRECVSTGDLGSSYDIGLVVMMVPEGIQSGLQRSSPADLFAQLAQKSSLSILYDILTFSKYMNSTSRDSIA
jgi:hypothetical protein